jgi:hypothetical protein
MDTKILVGKGEDHSKELDMRILKRISKNKRRRS